MAIMRNVPKLMVLSSSFNCLWAPAYSFLRAESCRSGGKFPKDKGMYFQQKMSEIKRELCRCSSLSRINIVLVTQR